MKQTNEHSLPKLKLTSSWPTMYKWNNINKTDKQNSQKHEQKLKKIIIIKARNNNDNNESDWIT